MNKAKMLGKAVVFSCIRMAFRVWKGRVGRVTSKGDQLSGLRAPDYHAKESGLYTIHKGGR